MSAGGKQPKAALALLGLALLGPARPLLAEEDAALKRSRAAEERGFVAVEEERWCDAYAAFLEANHFAPSVDLTFNAAQAADLAQDRKTAVKLYADLLGAYPDSERQEQVNQRLAELTKVIADEGPGEACPAPPSFDDAATTPDDAAAAPDEREGPREAETEGEARAPVSDDVAAPEGGTSGIWLGTVVPWSLAGGGGALTLLGAALAAVAVVPYFGHAQVRQQILDAEANQQPVPDGLHAQQAAFRSAWQPWGELALYAGLGMVGLGVSTLAVGATWGVIALFMGGSDPASDPGSDPGSAEAGAPADGEGNE